MQIFHLYHSQKLHRLAHSKFWQLEFAIWIHIFARTLISVFVPILLLQIGYDIGQIMIYYFIFTAIDVPLNFFARSLVAKIGARKVMLLSSLASILFFVFLYILTPNNWPLYTALAFFAAIYDSLYFVSHIYLFIKSETTSKNSRTQTSFLYIVKMAAVLLGPIIGAGILILTNRHLLILTAVVFFALSALPPLHIKKLADKPRKKIPGFKEFFKNKEDRRNFLSFTFFSVHRNAEIILWPLFIYSIFSSVSSVAYVPVIIALTTMIFSYMVGRIENVAKEKLIVIGAGLIGLIWLIRIFTHSNGIYYFSIFLAGLFALLVTIPLDSSIFERGKKISALNTATYRNAGSMLIQCILFGTLALAINVFKTGFIIAILSLFALLIINFIALRSTRSA